MQRGAVGGFYNVISFGNLSYFRLIIACYFKRDNDNRFSSLEIKSAGFYFKRSPQELWHGTMAFFCLQEGRDLL